MVALTDVRTAEIRADDAQTEPPAGPVGRRLPDAWPGAGDVSEPLRRRCTAVIDAEMTRLERRTSLEDAELAVVTGAPHRLAAALPLEGVGVARYEPPLVAALFDLERTC